MGCGAGTTSNASPSYAPAFVAVQTFHKKDLPMNKNKKGVPSRTPTEEDLPPIQSLREFILSMQILKSKRDAKRARFAPGKPPKQTDLFTAMKELSND